MNRIANNLNEKFFQISKHYTDSQENQQNFLIFNVELNFCAIG
jgi:hypothetical protein